MIDWDVSCRDVSLLLSEARDSGRPLGWRVWLHLSICDVCRRVRAQLNWIGAMVRKEPAGGPGLSKEAKNRLKRALDER